MTKREYKPDDEGYDIRYVDGERNGRVPYSNICDADTEYVIRWVEEDDDSEWWVYRQLGSDFRNIDEVVEILPRVPGLEDDTHIQIILNFGRVKETFGIERIQYLMQPDIFVPVHRIDPYKERILNLRYHDDVDLPAVDAEPSARGKGESPADIDPKVLEAVLDLIDHGDDIKDWHEEWRKDTGDFERGEFYDRIYAPLSLAYSIIDEEVLELVYRYRLEQGSVDELSKKFMRAPFRNKLDEVEDLLTKDEKHNILEGWQYRNELVHSVKSRFGIKIREIDFEQLAKQLLFSIMKLRTLNTYVNSAQYRPGVEGPVEAIAHQMGSLDYEDAVTGARNAVQDERYFKPQFTTI
jgi:hypothetical protein